MDNYIKRSCVTEVLLNSTSLEGYDLEEAVNAICAIPAADVRPVVRGRWEVYDADFNSYSCSACGEPFTLNDGTPQENNMNFCPNCGADMREES